MRPPHQRTMAAQRIVFHVLCLTLAAAAPGRVPKVYNALITSNQNLEPSKAYPVYQPVIQDAFSFPFQPVFYPPDYAPSIFSPPNNAPPVPPQTAPPPSSPEPRPSSTEDPQPPSEPESPKTEDTDGKNRPALPAPPQTESPIPLNQFGLPPQVLPLGRVNPGYNGFTHIAPFSYSYPGPRFYDFYDPFGFNPYLNLPPVYRIGPNSIVPQGPQGVPKPAENEPTSEASPAGPPSEPSDSSILNYSPKDPSIPDVPPPPLPQGGPQTDKSE